ncbi:thioredoxin superfamily protein [Actinidia rufa]|uniref:Thioredoxin-like protein HCF164, chloroplastic n=1 Tax=Actinidia rufa TaxID=165716 RepID=A0A7J0D8V4_9ERIC|nr:thioredoxin superfamily protein [Actinidia rufa]
MREASLLSPTTSDADADVDVDTVNRHLIEEKQSDPRRDPIRFAAAVDREDADGFSLLDSAEKFITDQKEKPLEEPGEANVDTAQAADSSVGAGIPEYPSKNVNKQIALVSTLAAVGLFLSARLDLSISLKDLSAMALPCEEALSNGKPTVVEFYANWCEVCRELAPDVYKVEQQYKDRVNFVMLNVDNTKWEQELGEFGVEGIPHFAFLDKKGNEEGNVVGRLPRQYFLDNVDALGRGEASVPHARVVGAVFEC